MGEEAKIKVLVVDDEATIRATHKAGLERLGIEVDEAANGQDAVDLLASGACYDLILMDLNMPVMDGNQATRRLRAMGVKTTIIGATSAADDWADSLSFYASGLDDYAPKHLVLDCISSYLNRPGPLP